MLQSQPIALSHIEKAPATPATALLAWYDIHQRKLPWRPPPGQLADPYAVWLSEIMLQQTSVAAVGPYYRRFLDAWPTVSALAAASDDDIMRAWAGLGYYARARNLLAAARKVAASGGAFPDTEPELRALPGVGAYTAAAVAAIAFGRRAVVVDGNVERVVARLAAIETPLPQAKPDIYAATDAITPHTRAGDFAQAMMDLGATICTPTKPACILCPLTPYCHAYKSGAAETFPRKNPKKARPERFGQIFVAVRADGALLVQIRPPKGLLGGMSEFPGGAWGEARRDDLCAAPLPLQWRKMTGEVVHIFTHFALRLAVYKGCASQETPPPPGTRWVAGADLGAQALPSLMRKVAVLAGVDARRSTD